MSTLTPTKPRAENVLTPRPLIEVRQIVLEANPFGHEHAKLIRAAIAGSQVGDVRQAVAELLNTVADGEGGKRNHMALGISTYLLARHNQAVENLTKVSGDATASYYLAQALASLGRFDEAAEKFEQAGSQGWDGTDCTLLRAGADAHFAHRRSCRPIVRR